MSRATGAAEWTFTTADPDETAPTVSGRSPTDLATDVAVGTNVTATFSEPVTGVSGTTFDAREQRRPGRRQRDL